MSTLDYAGCFSTPPVSGPGVRDSSGLYGGQIYLGAHVYLKSQSGDNSGIVGTIVFHVSGCLGPHGQLVPSLSVVVLLPPPTSNIIIPVRP